MDKEKKYSLEDIRVAASLAGTAMAEDYSDGTNGEAVVECIKLFAQYTAHICAILNDLFIFMLAKAIDEAGAEKRKGMSSEEKDQAKERLEDIIRKGEFR